jgi:hypothetical protein
MNSFFSLVAAAVVLSLSAHSQFIFRDSNGNQISSDQFFANQGSRNQVYSSGPSPDESDASSYNSKGNDDNDRRNYYDENNNRISKQEYISKYGTAMIEVAGNDDRANIHPTYVD